MNVVKALITFLVMVLFAVTVLFIDFSYKTFSYRQVSTKADAIVVLAGGKGRVEEGVRLFRESRAEYLYFIGVNPSVQKSDLYRVPTGDKSSEKIILEKASRNTFENALFGRDLIVRQNIRSIILITSRYHLKRASILFRNSLPKDIAIYPYPVDSNKLKESWWSDGDSFNLLFREFYKYCMFRVFFLLTPGELRDSGVPVTSRK